LAHADWTADCEIQSNPTTESNPIQSEKKKDGERLMYVWHHILPSGKMGLSISYPPDDYLPAVEDDMGRLFIWSLSFDDMEAAADSPSYSPSALPPAFGSGKLIMEGSLGFFERRETDSVQMQNVLSIRNPKPPNREACSSVSPGAATATCGSRRRRSF
jgi:hypothetical protein